MGEKTMKETKLFGSAFETTLRILLLLDELSGEFTLDEQQLCCIDFMAIYGADFDLADENLHGNGLFRFSEFSAKSILVNEAIKKLVLRSLVDFTPTKAGYTFAISPLGHKTAMDMSDHYADEYRIAVREVSKSFPSLQADQMQNKIYTMTIKSLEATNE